MQMQSYGKLVCMKYLLISITFLISSFSQAHAIPECDNSAPVWTDCFASYSWPSVKDGTGYTYSGEWTSGRKHGFGTFIYPNGNKYIGEFINGEFEGTGSYYHTSGDLYIGGWQNGLFEGYGTYYFQSGKIYQGKFTEGKRNGSGTLTLPDGKKITGEWQHGKLNGPGTIYNADGSIYRKVIFEKGKAIALQED